MNNEEKFTLAFMQKGLTEEEIAEIRGEMQNPEVDHPNHYNDYPIECIEMMRRIWGDEVVATWCEITAFKYRMRAGHKGNIVTDFQKERWYLDKAKELRTKECSCCSGGCTHECKKSCH